MPDVSAHAYGHKLTKIEVGYEHPAKGSENCGGCAHFKPLREKCEIVTGRIQAEDWCRKWKPKSP